MYTYSSKTITGRSNHLATKRILIYDVRIVLQQKGFLFMLFKSSLSQRDSEKTCGSLSLTITFSLPVGVFRHMFSRLIFLLEFIHL